MDGCPTISRRTWLIIAFGIVGVSVINSTVRAVIREANGLDGFWEVCKITDYETGLPAEPEYTFRLFLEIEYGKAEAGQYYTCGQRANTLLSGPIEVYGDRILVRQDPTDPYSVPAELTRLRNGHLSIAKSWQDGKSYRFEFERTANADTIFDELRRKF